MSDVLAAMAGRWLLCGNESVFAADRGDVGLEITTDNQWYKLFPAQGATTIRGAGFASTPRAMRLNNNGVFVGNYVSDPTVPTGSVRCAPESDPTRDGG